MKNILITGGCGYIGSHTCLKLLKKGFNIFIIDSNINSSEISLKMVTRLCNAESKFQGNLKFFKEDISLGNNLEKIFEYAKSINLPIDSVIHFAGLKSVEQSTKKPILYWNKNLIGTIKLLQTMEKFGCKKIVFSSSAIIYESSNKPLKENSTLKPLNPYGSNKLAIESFLKDVFQSNSTTWKIANLRYFNPIGSHSSGLLGESPLGVPNNIFPLISKSAYEPSYVLKVFGNDWPTKDGTPIRDYIHVMDLAEGHIKTLEYLEKSNPQILHLNLGTGKGTSVLELINIFQKVNKVKVPFTYEKRREGDVASLIADNSKAISLLGWFPKRELEIMCRDGWKWKKNFPNGY
jgi:UDP-glucose 4-epimerase